MSQPEATNKDIDAGQGDHPTQPGRSFFDFHKIELDCITDLRRLRDLVKRMDLSPQILERTNDVLRRAERRHFSIAVVGEFKRGKSTFINALLGKDILPADILPCSATVNRVTYGPKPGVEVRFKSENGEPPKVEKIAIDRLSDYVTKLTPESETTAAQVEEAVVTYPSEYCRNNVDIIDTPGLNDDDTMTSVTLSVVPKVDAAILVIMPESPFSGYEGEFLTRHLLLQDLGRVLFVVTAIDRLPDDEQRQRIVDVIEQRIDRAVSTRLEEQFGKESEEYELYRRQIGPPMVFPISGYKALKAQEQGDDQLLEESRFPAFTDKLESFLTETRGVIELQVLVNRILATGDELVKKINLELGAMDMAQEEFEENYDEASGRLEGLRRRRDEEMKKIDQAAARTQDRLEPLVDRLEEDIQSAAARVIDDAAIQSSELDKKMMPALLERLGKKISQEVGQTSRRSGEKIQLEIERDLKEEAERLRDFAENVGKTLHEVVYKFSALEVEAGSPRSAGGESLAAAISVFTGFGGIWSGYREAGVKGAAVGGVASFGTAVAGGVVLAMAGAPITIPAILAISVISIFTGGFAARKLLGGTRVENFKKNYRETVREHLEEQLREQHLQSKVRTSISRVYDLLKEEVMGEISDAIEQTQTNLDELKSNKGSDTRLSEARRQDLQSKLKEVEGIRSKASRLSLQLSKIETI